MKVFVIAGAVLALAGAAQADEWGTNIALAGAGEAVDVTSIDRSNGSVAFWVLHVPSTPDTVSGKPVGYYMIRYRFDCVGHRYFMMSLVGYGITGEYLSGQTAPSGADNIDIVPGSVSANLEAVTCGQNRTNWVAIPPAENLIIAAKVVQMRKLVSDSTGGTH